MSAPQAVQVPGLSVHARILGAAVMLALMLYLATLAALGLPLKLGAQRHLDAVAERELGALREAVLESARAGDYPALERTLRAQAERFPALSVRYASLQGEVKVDIPPQQPAGYPAWFARLLDVRAPHAESALRLSGGSTGILSVALGNGEAVQGLWDMALRFSLAALACVAGSLLALRWLLHVNLRGLYALRAAAQAIERGDIDARVALSEQAPPEVRDTARAFNQMLDHVCDLVAALERKHDELLVEKERLRVTIESIGDAVVVTDDQGRIEFINPRAEALTGFRNREARGRQVSEILPLVDERGDTPASSPLELALQRNAAVGLDSHTIRSRDGATIAISDSAAPIRSPDGRVQGGVLVFQDESERRKLMQRLAWQAERDHLTGLWNRRALEDRLSAALHDARHENRHFVFCHIDLDRFKLVNDTCGHRAGDALLKRVAGIMARRIEGKDHFLARLGGDEFGLLFVDSTLPEALDTIQDLRDEIGRFRFEWADKVFRLGVSVGVTELHRGTADVGEVLAQSDTSCYHAKSLGGNGIQVYEKTHPALQKISDEMQWVSEVIKAFEAHRFTLYRQKKVALKSDTRTEHYEILLRLRGEDGTIITPGEFLPAAERYGLAPSFDRWVIRNVFAYLDTHPEDQASYALNLSGRSLSDPGTAEFILDEIRRYQIEPARISFEVTETAAIDSLDACERLIAALKSLGIEFALDDFGKGQSSFGYLKRLPVACLKIDGDFVRGMSSDREKLAIVKAMHTLGHELGKLTVAEQVETEADLACLRHMGVDFVQGFLLDAPSPLTV